MSGFAVVDIGTTGLHPAFGQRLVEVAVVQVSDTGAITGAWDTLVNPQCDLPAQPIHGVAAHEVVDAPLFADIAGTLSEVLEGRVLVAHDHRFVARFIDAEFRRLGYEVPTLGVCTMELGLHYVGPSRSLIACCHCFGIEITDERRMTLAHATAALLSSYLAMDPGATHWRVALSQARASRWPRIDGVPANRLSREPEDDPAEQFLSRLVHRLPDLDLATSSSQYLATLDRALLDRHLSVAEVPALTAIAAELGVGRFEEPVLHTHYLRQLAIAAWTDGEVTEEQRNDLHTVGHLLGYDTDAVDNALLETAPDDSAVPVPAQSRSRTRTKASPNAPSEGSG